MAGPPWSPVGPRRRFLALGLAAAALVASCSTAPVSPQAAADEGALQVGFLVVDGVYNSELMAPWDVFHHTVFHSAPGMRVFTLAPSREPITTFEGIRILPDHTLEDAPAIDVLVVPSAEHSMDSDLEDAALIGWVTDVGARASHVLSLCDGAFVLAQAGLLEGLECTTFPGDVAAFRARFPDLLVHEGLSFVHDGKVLTSAGGARSYEAALYLCERLYGDEAARGIARGLVIDWDLDAVPHVTTERAR